MEKKFTTQKAVIKAAESISNINAIVEKANEQKAEMDEMEIKPQPLFDNVTLLGFEQLNNEIKRFTALYTTLKQ